MHVVEFEVYAPYSESIHALDIAIVVYTGNRKCYFGSVFEFYIHWPRNIAACVEARVPIIACEGKSPRERKKRIPVVYPI